MSNPPHCLCCENLLLVRAGQGKRKKNKNASHTFFYSQQLLVVSQPITCCAVHPDGANQNRPRAATKGPEGAGRMEHDVEVEAAADSRNQALSIRSMAMMLLLIQPLLHLELRHPQQQQQEKQEQHHKKVEQGSTSFRRKRPHCCATTQRLSSPVYRG